MPEAIPSTFFTRPPEWSWLIVWYFFLGGLAGGAAFIAAILELIGRPGDRPLIRVAYYIAFPAMVISTLLLIADLGRPERFWHMIVQSETARPAFKSWSPISFGAWLVGLFTIFTFIGFVRSFVEEGYLRWGWLADALRDLPGKLFAVLSGLLGLWVAGYTGVLLAVTNRPIWADTSFLGALFLLSGASTAAAALILAGHAMRPVPDASVHRLERLDTGVMLLELLALLALVFSLGVVARVWLSWWGALLVVGVVLAGILVPLALHARRRRFWPASVTAAVLVLIGGFLLRVVMVLSSEGIPYGG
ncbi:MAG TPA: NrfD/PsrC family molybdoenzyme membrane anchor subunit [Thermodesulfobacteriota bacterium]